MLRKLIKNYYQRGRIYLYKSFNNNKNVEGTPSISQPVLLLGEGQIIFGKNVCLGYFPSPFYYNGIIHIEARRSGAKIIFGDNIFINNNFSAICEGSTISIGDEVLIGTNVEIIDSNFHGLHPKERNSGKHGCKDVFICRNVFIGSNVRILKGITIGENSVISNGSIVTTSFPANVIIGGNPAIIISNLYDGQNKAD